MGASRLRWKRFVEKVSFEPGMEQRMSNRTNLNWNYPENLNNTLVQNRHYDTAGIPTCKDLASLETKPDAIHQKPSKSYKTVFFFC